MKISSDIVEATEAAAIAASEWIGSGEKELADKAATEAMRHKLNREIEIAGRVVMGEGEKDESFGLFKGETVPHTGFDMEPENQHGSIFLLTR